MIQLKYAGYIGRQQQDIDRVSRHEKMSIPADMDFSQVDGLSNEIRQKLSEHRPVNLASRSNTRRDAGRVISFARAPQKTDLGGDPRVTVHG